MPTHLFHFTFCCCEYHSVWFFVVMIQNMPHPSPSQCPRPPIFMRATFYDGSRELQGRQLSRGSRGSSSTKNIGTRHQSAFPNVSLFFFSSLSSFPFSSFLLFPSPFFSLFLLFSFSPFLLFFFSPVLLLSFSPFLLLPFSSFPFFLFSPFSKWCWEPHQYLKGNGAPGELYYILRECWLCPPFWDLLSL